jgi:hypothetical protein
MTTIDEYMELYIGKDPKVMKRVGMDKDQKESVNNPCRWTAAILERIGDELEHSTLKITKENQHRLARIMRSVNNDCRKCKDC